MLVLAVAGANARILFGGTWDDVRYHTEISPARLAAATAVQHGALPAWWEGSGLGVPLAGEPSHGAMYPPAWIAASPRAIDWLAMVHLMWLAIGVAVWARYRSPQPPRLRIWLGGASEPAAVVVALLVATSGLATSVALRGALPALAHLPWIGVATCWLAEAETRATRARAAAVLGLAIGMVGLAGNFAGLFDALVLAGVLIVRRPRRPDAPVIEQTDRGRIERSSKRGDRPVRPDSERRGRDPFLVYVLAALAGGLAISTAQWLPALLHLASPHAGSEVAGLPLARLIELVVPTASGSPNPERAIAMLAGDRAWAPSLFVGAPLLALAAVRVPSRRVLAIAGVFVALTLTAGRGGWPAWLGAPEVHLAALAIVLGAHAGSGVDALVGSERRAILALAAGIGCTVIALIALAVQRSRTELPAGFEIGLINGALGVACGIGAIAIAYRGARRAIPAVFALLAIPSFGAGPGIASTTDRGIVSQQPAWAEAALATHLGRVVPNDPTGKPLEVPPPDPALEASIAAAPRRVYRRDSLIETFGERSSVTTPTNKPAAEPAERESLTDAFETFAGTTAARWGIGAARSDDPARHADHDATWLAAASGGGRLLDRFGIGLAVLPESLVTPRGFTALSRRGRWALVALPVAPPASVMRSWVRAVEPANAFSLLFPFEDSLSLPRGTVVLGEPGDASPPKPKDAPIPCAIEDWSAGNIELSCTSEARGYAVVSSGAAPGWSVTVDGAEAHWTTADVLRRAVAVPAGAHRVHWSYAPPGLRLGLIVAGIGLALLIALLLASRR